MNWFEAEEYCEKLGGFLASIHSEKEMNKIAVGQSLSSKSSTFWIGLNRINSSTFKWNDKSTFKFNKWKNGEPNNLNRHEMCTKIQSNGLWVDNSCFVVGGWICKLKKGVIPPSTQIIVEELFPGNKM